MDVTQFLRTRAVSEALVPLLQAYDPARGQQRFSEVAPGTNTHVLGVYDYLVRDRELGTRMIDQALRQGYCWSIMCANTGESYHPSEFFSELNKSLEGIARTE